LIRQKTAVIMGSEVDTAEFFPQNAAIRKDGFLFVANAFFGEKKHPVVCRCGKNAEEEVPTSDV